jgi:soluble lytic murein transglycosylase-like protein
MGLKRTTIRCLTGCALLVLAVASPASSTAAEKKRTSFGNVTEPAPRYRIYTYRQPNGVRVFSDSAPSGQSYQLMEFSCYACNPQSTVNWNATRLFTDEYASTIDQVAKQHGVDPALVRAVIHAESGFNPRARSHKGAMGLMQLMPGTASDMGVSDPMQAAQNIRGGVKYLALMLEKFNGNVSLATAAYNAGPAAVEKYRGIPPFDETQVYVKRVKVLQERYKAQS